MSESWSQESEAVLCDVGIVELELEAVFGGASVKMLELETELGIVRVVESESWSQSWKRI